MAFMEDYLQPEDYVKAKKNGIPATTLYHRFYIYGWDKDRATTTPMGYRKKSEPRLAWEKWKEKAKENNVARHVFYRRLREGWTAEEAATTEVKGIGKTERNRVISDEIYTLAKKNGIGRSTLQNRVYNCAWDPKRAATQPVNKKCNWRKQA